ncbi:MAG: DUF4276 family protein [Chloroflexota bacterium]
MDQLPRPTVNAVVEGITDEPVARRLIEYCGADLGQVFGRRGKAWVRARISGYNTAAAKTRSLWLVLVDLDRDFPCAAELRDNWLPERSPRLCFRVAVHELEAWLLADRDAIATYLGIRTNHVPADPDRIERPKRALLDLVARSRNRELKTDMLPRPSSGASEGPAYASRLIEYVESKWRPDVAATSSDSLRRCVERVRELCWA